jgi:hypothetical protein
MGRDPGGTERSEGRWTPLVDMGTIMTVPVGEGKRTKGVGWRKEDVQRPQLLALYVDSQIVSVALRPPDQSTELDIPTMSSHSDHQASEPLLTTQHDDIQPAIGQDYPVDLPAFYTHIRLSKILVGILLGCTTILQAVSSARSLATLSLENPVLDVLLAIGRIGSLVG